MGDFMIDIVTPLINRIRQTSQSGECNFSSRSRKEVHDGIHYLLCKALYRKRKQKHIRQLNNYKLRLNPETADLVDKLEKSGGKKRKKRRVGCSVSKKARNKTNNSIKK